jgi:hypothetical protein
MDNLCGESYDWSTFPVWRKVLIGCFMVLFFIVGYQLFSEDFATIVRLNRDSGRLRRRSCPWNRPSRDEASKHLGTPPRPFFLQLISCLSKSKPISSRCRPRMLNRPSKSVVLLKSLKRSTAQSTMPSAWVVKFSEIVGAKKLATRALQLTPPAGL